MRLMVLFILLNVFGGDINKISRINQAKRMAEEAYRKGEFESAISAFRLLSDSLGVNEDPILLNLGNAYFHQNDTTNAAQYYSRVLGSEDPVLRSVAYQQLGIIKKQQNKLKEAIADFKTSLKSNPNNEDARYNYELLKKIIDEQEQQQQNENKDIEPSEYAKRLKARADNLVKQNMFDQAMSLMQKGLEEDETVAAYNSFISKLNDVVESKK
jgi:tetratricopeptide (TPR) repeat protein